MTISPMELSAGLVHLNEPRQATSVVNYIMHSEYYSDWQNDIMILEINPPLYGLHISAISLCNRMLPSDNFEVYIMG